MTMESLLICESADYTCHMKHFSFFTFVYRLSKTTIEKFPFNNKNTLIETKKDSINERRLHVNSLMSTKITDRRSIAWRLNSTWFNLNPQYPYHKSRYRFQIDQKHKAANEVILLYGTMGSRGNTKPQCLKFSTQQYICFKCTSTTQFTFFYRHSNKLCLASN